MSQTWDAHKSENNGFGCAKRGEREKKLTLNIKYDFLSASIVRRQ
jgi:hypothetical protein